MNTVRPICVILDDDPTGTQTVHDITVLTSWREADLVDQMNRDEEAFFLLTNTRSLSRDKATRRLRTIGRAIRHAAQHCGRSVTILLRGDSTLRSHFPAEPLAIESVFGPADKWIIVPFFLEGGRLTIDGTHYIRQGRRLTPVADTPFARDPGFGYQHSYLPAWVEEKTGGCIPQQEVQCFDSPFRALEAGPKVCIVNARRMSEIRSAARVCRQMEVNGRHLIYLTAASFVSAYLDNQPRLLSPQALCLQSAGPTAYRGGLIVAGSYVPNTTTQLQRLLTLPGISAVQLQIPLWLTQPRRHFAAIFDEMSLGLAAGQTVLLYTSRELIASHDSDHFLNTSRRISSALARLVRKLPQSPRFLIAKGGITSSDLATHALGIRRANVLGQALPGVPVWQPGPDSRFPGLPVIIFPGNVGAADDLLHLVKQLTS